MSSPTSKVTDPTINSSASILHTATSDVTSSDANNKASPTGETIAQQLNDILSASTPTGKSSAQQSHSSSNTKQYKSVLVLGGGGREHALVWKLTQSQRLASDYTIYVSPGNGGTATIEPTHVQNVPYKSVADTVQLLKDKGIEFVVVGPEDPLNDGIVDAINQQLPSVKVFGPSQKAAQIECNKAFSKAFMNRYNIPTAKHQTFTKFSEAEQYLQQCKHRVVVKASGLAAGKGVIIPTTTAEAITACREMLEDNKFGSAGSSVVVEEFLNGFETSVLAFSDGTNIAVMPPAQDHKRLLDFDRGLNTGGMGAFAPTPNVSPALLQTITEEILKPAIAGMQTDGTPFKGILYAGVLVCKNRPYALEYNARFGDPETQVLLPLLDSDLLTIFEQCVDGTLDAAAVRWKQNTSAATVVAVSEGYPEAYPKGRQIEGVWAANDKPQTNGIEARQSSTPSLQPIVFHAGTSLDSSKQLVTSGGRVLAVTALGDSLQAATRTSYNAIENIYFDGMYYRHDIGGSFHRPHAVDKQSQQPAPLRIGVLGSTKGTDMQYIQDAIDAGMLPFARIVVVISNKADSGILQKAKQHNIPAVHIASKDKTRQQFDAEACRLLESHHVDLVLLIGFMRIVSPYMIDRYYWRVLNVHPSLLPEFAGGMDTDVHSEVLKAKKHKSGCTIHFVTPGPVDSGPMLIQKAVDISADETADTLKSKVQALEGQAFIEAIQMFARDDSKSLLTQILRSGYPTPKPLFKFYRRGALTAAATEQLVTRINASLKQQASTESFDDIQAIDTELCYYIEFEQGTTIHSLSTKERHSLEWLLRETYEPQNLAEHSMLNAAGGSTSDIIETGPRLSFTSAWSTNAVSICKNVGLKVTRLEPFRRYQLHTKSNKPLSSTQRSHVESLLHDRMTEMVVNKPLETFQTQLIPQSWSVVPVLENGKAALHAANNELGLGLDSQDIEFYYNLFHSVLQRNPTDVELFDVAQSNSEHSRHWFFRGKLVIDKQPVTTTLMKIVKETLDAQPDNSVVAFADNSSAIRGFTTTILEPSDPTKACHVEKHQKERHLLLTAETHNFPSGVAPFPGAETGTGGRIRDTHATGRGSVVAAGVCGYAVGNLNIPGYDLPWESKQYTYPQQLASPLQIEIQASNGASDYGNKFGEPVVGGFTRSYGQHVIPTLPKADSTADQLERREYIKPIMFSAGIGFLDAIQAKKQSATPGLLVVKIGGPAYRIGMGGSAASSMMQGEIATRAVELDYNAVQRGDAEMENKLNRVVRACVELGELNPILSIHDQGAAGNSNVLKEIVEPSGGRIDIRSISVGDQSLSVLEIWGAEYQESDALLIEPDKRGLFAAICQRERCPVDFCGVVTGDGQVVVYDSTDGSTPVDLNLDKVLGNMPMKTFDLQRGDELRKPLYKPITLASPAPSLSEVLDRLLRLLSVGSKRFLTNKVDRSVTGLIAQQPCVGPLHTPLADVSVLASSMLETHGVASAIGEQPIKGLISPAAMARLTVGEALTNLMFAKISKRSDIKCSANWMWAAKLPGEGAALYDAAIAMRDVMLQLGVAVDGGKDSLSMAAKTAEGELVKAPGTLVVTLYAPCTDIRLTVTPDLKQRGNSTLLYINMSTADSSTSEPTCSLGGSAFATVYNQLGSSTADLHDTKHFNAVFDTVQTLIEQQLILAGHDISDGGLLVAALEMSFAGNVGVDLTFAGSDSQLYNYAHLFGEQLGCILEIDNQHLDQVYSAFQSASLPKPTIIGQTNTQHTINVQVNDKPEVQSTPVGKLRAVWEATSYELEKLQMNVKCAESESEQLQKRTTDPAYKLTFTPKPTPSALIDRPASQKPRVAVIREEGSNGDREMQSALYLAGFDAWDVHMSDLINGTVSLRDTVWRGIAFVGGFGYADVLNSAKGWAAVIKLHPELATQFAEFRARPDTFSLGVCNGCQLLALLGWVGALNTEEEKQLEINCDNPPARFTHNLSGRYESRFVSLRVAADSPAVMLRNMGDSVIGCWLGHGEGTAYFPGGAERQKQVEAAKLVPLRYADDSGKPTEVYPMNPNFSPAGIAGLVSPDGRHLAMMPHAERCHQLWQFPWQPRTSEWQQSVAAGVSPWLQMFQNARAWCDETAHLTPKTSASQSQPHPPTVDTSLPTTSDAIINSSSQATASTLASAPSADRIVQQQQVITASLNNTLHETNFHHSALTARFTGKVRDTYKLADSLMVLVTSDRLSAFDRQLADIPFKGAVLNDVAAWWFQRTAHIIPNHFVASPHPNVTIGKQCKPFPVEVVVRGYITGTTGTSLWTHYNKGVRNYCGNALPEGLKKNEKLAANIVTPTTKSDEHDVPISGEDIVKQGLMFAEHWQHTRDAALKLFEFGQETALRHGLLLVDTKYEFGLDVDGQVTLIDEIHTPDSSRYWLAASYEQQMAAGKEPESVDKEFLRLWYAANCDPYNDKELPAAPQDKIVELSRRYIQLYEMITGQNFPLPDESQLHTNVGVDAERTTIQWIEEWQKHGQKIPPPVYPVRQNKSTSGNAATATASASTHSAASGAISPRTHLMDQLISGLGGKII